MFYSLSSRAHLEVKWANTHKGNPLFYKTAHRNPHYNLIIVFDGPVYLETDGDPLTLQSGEILLLAPWQEHQGWRLMEEHAGFFWIQFTSDRQLEPIDNVVRAEDKISLLMPESNDLRTSAGNHLRLLIPRRMQTQSRFELMVIVEKLLRELERPQGYFRVRMSVLLWTIMEKLADEMLQQSSVDLALPSSFLTYRRIINTLDETYAQDRPKEFYENHLNLTYEYICNVFKKYAGITITAYIQQLRLQQAQDMLRRTEKPIQQVAAEVGYGDPYYFSKLFKKTTGLTPTQFREGK